MTNEEIRRSSSPMLAAALADAEKRIRRLREHMIRAAVAERDREWENDCAYLAKTGKARRPALADAGMALREMERERCARVAESFHDPGNNPEASTDASRIADAIRRGPEE